LECHFMKVNEGEIQADKI